MSRANILNQNELRFFGLQRTGNHAIISWVLDHVDGPSIHLNDIQTYDSNPYVAFAQVNTKNISFWKCKPSVVSFVKHVLISRDDTYRFVSSDVKLAIEFLRELPKTNLLLSYENYSPDAEQILELNARHDEFLGRSGDIRRIILLRDPFNLFASLIKAKMIDESKADNLVSVYKQYARIFLENRTTSTRDDSTVCVNYNLWFANSDYRKEVANRIGFKTDGRPNQRIGNEGAGSSFDGLSLDGEASRLKVLERWKAFESDSFYRRLLSDSELIALSSQLFDFDSLGVSLFAETLVSQ